MKKTATYSLVIRWILIITLLFGILAAFQILPYARAAFIEEITVGMLAKSFLFGHVIGIFIASAQWRILRNFSIGVIEWLIATSIGFGFGWSLGLLVDFFAIRFGSEYLGQGGPITAMAYGLTIAATAAVSKYYILRRKYKGAKAWLSVTFIGWAFGQYVSALPYTYLIDRLWYFAPTVVGVLFGAVFGTTTAMGLVYITKTEKSLAG